MKTHAAVIVVGACLLALGSIVQAQTAPKDQPVAVGTSQETANAAHRKATKDGDAATVVRTGPTAGDKASQMTSDSKEKVKETTDKVRSRTGTADDTKKP